MKKTPLKWAVLAALAANLTIQTAQAAPQGSIEERLQRLERMADNPVLLQLTQRLEQQQRQIQELQDKMDRLQRDQQRFLQQAAERYAETDQRISALENAAKTQQAGLPPVALPQVPQAAAPIPVQTATQEAIAPAATAANAVEEGVSKVVKTRAATAEENTLYQSAFALMRAAKYEESIAAFEDFVAKYPQSSLASNASYWAGEGYLIRKDNAKALQAFERVLEQYPDSTKAPDAMLRAADSLVNLQKSDAAQALYRKVVDTYPETRAAQSAQKRLNK